MCWEQSKPIIEHIIEKLSNEGFKQFYISVNYLADKIKNYFGNGKNFGVKINYIKEYIICYSSIIIYIYMTKFINLTLALVLISSSASAEINSGDTSKGCG